MAIAHRRTVLPAPLLGVNYTSNLLSIGRNQVYKARNCHLDDNGVLRTRKGSTLLNTTALDGSVTSIYDFRYPSGTSTTSEVLVTAGEKLYSYDGTTFTELDDLSSSTRPTWVTFTDSSGTSQAVMANGTDFKMYDGTTVTDITFVTSIDAPRYLTVFGARVMASGCDSDPYTVFVSAANDCTSWMSGAGSTAIYWTVKGAKGDRVTALAVVYNYCMFFQQFGATIITDPDPSASGVEQIHVSREYGTSSHWSVQTVGNIIYFADESHFYKGTLRAAIENGLDVETIDSNIIEKYKTVKNANDIVSAYDAEHKEIQWGTKTLWKTRNDTTFVYSIARSGAKGELGMVDVWSGWFDGDGYEPYTLAIVNTSDDKMKVYRGDEDGYVYRMEDDTQYKDEKRVSGVTVDKAIVTEIYTGVLKPSGLSINKRARSFLPYLYQQYDNSTKIQWVIDGRYVKPDTDRYVILRNLIPYWNDDVTRYRQLWGNTLWNNEPVMPRPIALNEPFQYIQFAIINDGDNNRDSISYSGGELFYQPHKQRRYVG